MQRKRIDFTGHAILKMKILKEHGFKIERNLIEDSISSPDKLEIGYKGRKIAQKAISPTHVLRVVYEDRLTEIRIITFYPGRKERYEKD